MVDMSSDNVEDFLAHYGVLGMHWGVRKSETSTFNYTDPDTGKKSKISYDPKKVNISRSSNGSVKIDSSNKRAKATVQRQITKARSHPDHDKTRATLKKPISSVSSKDLKAVNERLNLEKQYSQLKFERSKIGRGKAQVAVALGLATTAGAAIGVFAKPQNQKFIKAGVSFLSKTTTKNATAFLTNPNVYRRAANVAKIIK